MPGMMEFGEVQSTRNGTLSEGHFVSEPTTGRLLFGGAITCRVPSRFVDVSDIREVPDNQEVLCDYDREESIIIELLEFKSDVSDEDSARWFLQNVAEEQEAENTVTIEDRRVLTVVDVPHMPTSTVMNAACGHMTITKTRQFDGLPNIANMDTGSGTSTQHLVKAHLANIRLRNVETDVVITINEKLDNRPQTPSSTALEPATPEEVSRISTADLLSLVLRTLKIEDWTLFVS
ncbi:hypothetical protein MPTK1_1g02960 [Marchantia polymorpha subsp. ruderalis]|uniref:Ran guanine nucleotide release factor n=2 Tax=Marchantia polymorpha TaxID=3197 RepID=A0A176VGS7_MARPO|nr:hypothetical protein AXG93_2584s1440 [Marchantia polymorpha subsp. ruderalis]PTQ31317.1 hypothetical protein MARPO_0113s0045 [Marchantia polymorpha]BBM97093.1 hypothetical protein Mp_1g02960 [Marchantia polymorpha subsp. ruderalis]|eukprot:PTQ31317.1 hypothetical protein MARPO_0113s0045 [Marchantia polymorpha]